VTSRAWAASPSAVRMLPTTTDISASGLTYHELQVPGQPKRQYAMFVPANSTTTTTTMKTLMPLLLYLHGQGDAWPGNDAMQFDRLAVQNGFAVVYPKGLGDFGGTIRDDYIAWNVGLYDHGMARANATCYRGTTEGACYDSCIAAGTCSQCGWSTCHDDVAFISALVDALHMHGTDPRRTYLTGASNGGMMVHHLARMLSHKFAAVAPVYGLPLVGFSELPSTRLPILQIHDRSDDTIPSEGGVSSDGWMYESLATVLAGWGDALGCSYSRRMVAVKTPWDGGKVRLQCQASRGCTAGPGGSSLTGPRSAAAPVVQCFFDGSHGDWPRHIEDLIWWFFEAQAGRGGASESDSL